MKFRSSGIFGSTELETEDMNWHTVDMIPQHRGDSAAVLLEKAKGFEHDVLEILLSYGVIFTNRQAAEAAKKIAALKEINQ